MGRLKNTGFENLEVYRLAERLADEIWKVVVDWEPFARSTIGRQLCEAADSVGANIAEGSGRGSFPDNRRFVKIGRGSLYERGTGFGGHSYGNCRQRPKSTEFDRS
jgi:hypothetical protein